MTDRRRVIRTASAPIAVGPYSQAIRTDTFLFTSGQIPLNPQTGLLEPGSIETQTRRVMENLRAVLADGGATFADVVKATVFLTNLADFSKMNAVYATYFPSDPPARSTVQVSALPLGASVEIEMIALVPGP